MNLMSKATGALQVALLLLCLHWAAGYRDLLQSSTSVSTSTSGGSGPSSSMTSLGMASSDWAYGTCPLVIQDGDFSGNDLASTPAGSISDCCKLCQVTLLKWQANTTEGIPPADVCIAWTYVQQTTTCYLKNGTTSGGKTSLQSIPGRATGSFQGNLTATQAAYDQFVNTSLDITNVQTFTSASATSTGSPASVTASCSAPHCQQILAKPKPGK